MPRISEASLLSCAKFDVRKPWRVNMQKIAILSLALLATGVGMSLPGMVRAEDRPAAPLPRAPLRKTKTA